MIERAVLFPARGFQPVAAMLYYTQRVLTPVARDVCATGIARLLAMRHPPSRTVDGEEESRVATLRKLGEVDLGQLLGPQDLRDVWDWVATRPAFDVDDHGRSFDPRNPPPDVRIGCYPLSRVAECPHLVRLANHPTVLGVVGQYLGCAPTISVMSLRWSFPRPGARQHALQTFHRDPDDWRFVKLFVYLSDVGAEGGPHEFIRTTHRERGTLRPRFLPDAEARTRYGDALSSFTGKAGKGFLVDTFGWHRGAPPTRRLRLMLTVQYSLLPVYSFVVRAVPATLVPSGTQGPAQLGRWVNRRILG